MAPFLVCYNIDVPILSERFYMKVIIGEYSSEVFPTNEDVQDICKVGQGADTCMFLTMGSTGWQCVALDWRMRMTLEDRADEMGASRKGCDIVNNFNPQGRTGEEIFLIPDR